MMRCRFARLISSSRAGQVRPASNQAAAARELVHFAGEYSSAVNREDRLLAVHDADQLDAAVQYNENAVLGVALIEDDFARGYTPLLAERDQPRNLRLVQLWEHPLCELRHFPPLRLSQTPQDNIPAKRLGSS